MTKYIESSQARKAVKRVIREYIDKYPINTEILVLPYVNEGIQAAITVIPAADVVEVVRCGKCRYYNRRWGCRKLEINVSADNYCFLAEPAVADREVVLPDEK